MISATNLTMRFGGKILFSNVNFQLNPGQHYGLVGANGSGKSTLIKMLIGEISPETGDLATPSQISVGSLKQDHFLYEDNVILDVVIMGRKKLWEAMMARDALLQKEQFDEQECEALAILEKTIAAYQGYAAASEAGKLLEGLGLAANTHKQLLKTLSGGFKLRVLLAQMLFSHPDVMLLDEPTNHLDIFSIRWLEGYLKNFPGTLLISSHDRAFLNAVCNHIVDIDYGTIKIYKGNYDAFEQIKKSEYELKETLLVKQEKKQEEIQEFIDRFKAKASKATQAQSRMRMVEKMEDDMAALNLRPSSRAFPHLRFVQHRPAGAIALTVKKISKAYGSKSVLEDISFEVERGERVAILGTNGVGKSTLLEILTKYNQADQGTFEWGFAAQHAYFPQDHGRYIQGKQTLLEWLAQWDRDALEQNLRQILGQVLFSGDDVHKLVHSLSGGEMARLILAKIMLSKHNVLIFDEPTNHLDIESTDALLEALHAYAGTLIFVSHNRYVVSRLATRIIEITPEHGLLDFKCSYEEYLSKRDVDLLSANKIRSQKSQEMSQQKSNFQEQKQQRKVKTQIERKVAVAEEKCHQIEQKIHQLDVLMSSEGFFQKNSLEKQQEIVKQKSELDAQLMQVMSDWEQASNDLLQLDIQS